MGNSIRNVALIGASGNVGSKTLEALLAKGNHQLTVITRPSSTHDYPASVTVKKCDYKDATAMEAALQGQDVLIIMVGFAGRPDQDSMLEAATKAGVKYILPNEFGAPSSDDRQAKVVPVIQGKREVLKKIEELGMKWTAVITNAWIDYSLQYGVSSIWVPERKATIFTDSGVFNTTTMARVGEGIAAMLALPADTFEEKFANNFLKLSSFRLTHPELFSTVLRVTGTSEADWQIERKSYQDHINEGWEMVNAGQMAGHFKIIYGVTYQPGMGGDYDTHNETLGLKQEDLDEVIKAAVDAARPGPWTAGDTLPMKN